MSERGALLTVLALLASQLVVFAVLDRRPMNDHDPEFAGVALRDALEIRRAPTWAMRREVLTRRLFHHAERHPQLPQAVLAAWTGATGWSRQQLRLSNLPWLLVLLLGTYLAARELAGPRLALLATWLVGTLPLVVHMSRKWFPQFHAAALAPLALWLALRLLRPGLNTRWAPWLALGAVQGLRLHAHPIGVPDVAILYGLLTLMLWTHADGRAWLLKLFAAVGLTALIGSPALFASTVHDEGVGFAHYLVLVGSFLGTDWLTGGVASWLGVARSFGWAAFWATLPGALLLVLLPGAVRAPRVLRASPGARLVALRVALHLPAVVLTVGNDGFLSDWMLLAPGVIVLATLGLGALGSRVLVVLAIAQGASTLLLPIGLSLSADALSAPATSGLRGLYGRSEHGGAWNTHHLLVRSEQAPTRIAELLPPDTEQIALLDLTFRARTCGTPDTTAGAWLWEASEDWFWAIPSDDAFAEAWGRTPDWLLEPEPASRPALVRVWVASDDPGPCTVTALQEASLLEGAAGFAMQRFGGAPETLPDPAQLLLVAPRPIAEPMDGYVGGVLLP